MGSSELPDFGPAWAAAHAKAKAKVRLPSLLLPLVVSYDGRCLTWSLTDAGQMLDEARKYRSLVVLIDREQHMALSIHFDALSARLAPSFMTILMKTWRHSQTKL